jgi:polar amino acid transport system substrate-binding protein
MSTPLSALRVGVDAAPPPPLCYGVPGDPEFKGFEVDLMHALAEQLERPLTFHASLWTELLDRLQAGQLDLICTAATITPERERQFLFSAPYLRTRLAVISRRDEAVVGLTGFSGRVGVREGTPAETHATNCGLQPVRFHFNDEVYLALEEGTLDAVVDDLPIGAWFARQAAALQLASLDGTDAQYGLVIRRDAPELKAALDRAMRSVIIEGTYSRLYERWLKALVGDACDVTAVMSP